MISERQNTCEVILKHINSEKERAEEAITSGDLKDYPSYRHMAGIVLGMKHIEVYVKDLMHPDRED